MIGRRIKAAGLAVLLGGGLSAVALPAHAAEPVTNVQIAWASAAHDKVRVTWTETGDEPNHVTVVNADNSSTGVGAGTAAGAANQLDIQVYPPDKVLKFAVTAGDPASAPTYSVLFDTFRPPRPVLDSVVPAAGGTVQVRFHAGTAVTDPNPNDPLDLTQPTTTYRAAATTPGINGWEYFGTPTTATTVTIPNWTAPHKAAVVTNANEWGFSGSTTAAEVRETYLQRAFIPASASYGTPTIVTGSIMEVQQACDPGPCWAEPVSSVGRTVVLQARDSATGAWYGVASTRTVDRAGSQFAESDFRFSVTTPGTRQYRVVVPNKLNGAAGFAYGVASNAVTTTARTNLLSAKFLDPTATYGQKVTAYLRVAPASSVRTTLQRWNGSSWVGVKYVTLSAGQGSYTFTAVTRGSVAYRFVVPGTTVGGRQVAGITTGSFVLTPRYGPERSRSRFVEPQGARRQRASTGIALSLSPNRTVCGPV